jgi:hypothetical protein
MPSEGQLFVREVVKNVKEFNAGLDEMVAAVDAASLKALMASQRAARTQIRQGMRGRPRWNHRGASSRTGPSITLTEFPTHSPRAGGPGKMTGYLRGAVGYMKKPVKKGREWHGGVGAGGGRTPITNLYKAKVEQKYPYMRTGVAKAAPKMRTAYEVAWAKATET